jgi:hypothetical protein
MLTSRQYKIIKAGIADGTYKRIRLVRIKENEEREHLTTYNGFIKGGEGQAIKRLDYIKHQLDKILPAGDYVIEATTTPTGNGGIVDSFKIKKFTTTVPISSGSSSQVQEQVEDHTNEQEQMSNFDIDDYKDLLTEISNLKVTVEVQKLQIQTLKAELAQKALNDSTPAAGSGIIKMVEEHAPTAMRILDEFLQQRGKSLELKEREITLAENGHAKNGKKKKVMSNIKREKTREEILSEMEALYDSDEASFNATLADMEEKNPELHEFICGEMFEDGEEEEEEQEEEQN